jgi:hypothetical protein
MTSLYFAGLDLGQSKDFTALAIAETEGLISQRVCAIRHLQRWPLGTSYPTICADVVKMLRSAPLLTAPLMIDATGVGRPVMDIFKQEMRSRRLFPVTITGGDAEIEADEDGLKCWRVPKRILVSTVAVLLQSSRLKIAASLPDAITLQHELENFQVKITGAGNDTYGAWREGAHDDLVLAVALACWGALNKKLISIPGVLGQALASRPQAGGSL